ncbi:UDP-3-O-(3-hydroxymyristoyl)glucosamine N-acyltransferase [Selenomonadales bacterium OttesenSCG-928-I06]|nr:UDP-3-O-(3-hydroxymyristoyl)glucosamine N-acyltransferase [Selenomonadales bacterium OttesenSCG-928-I06]
MKKKLKEIAEIIGGEIINQSEEIIKIEITGVNNIQDAGPSDITFAVEPHLEKAGLSNAAAVIVPETVYEFSKPAIRVANPRIAFTLLLDLYTEKPQIDPGIHSTVVIGKDVKIGDNVSIMAYTVIADGAVIGDNAVIYPHCYIGHKSKVGKDILLYPQVTIRENCTIGDRVIINSGAVVGSEGFGFVTKDKIHHKVPQVGGVLIEDDVEIGANSNIDRATTGFTVIKKGTKIDNLVHIAHNVVMGENCLIVAQTGISGSVIVGNNVTFAGQSGTAGHLKIGDNCVFTARAGIISDVESNSFYSGYPARPHREWLKIKAAGVRLIDFTKKIKELEEKIKKIEQTEK